MSCPHSRSGSPASCSLCIGAKPKQVRHDAAGRLIIDDKPAPRNFDPGVGQFGSRRKKS